MQPEIDLSGLKDLHILTRPDWWPLAYGWWIIIGLICFTILLCLMAWLHWHQRPDVYAIRKLHKINQKESNDLLYIKKISQLLRRVAIAADGRANIAQLSDTTWQDFLQNRVPNLLSQTEAHLIAFAPYESEMKDPLDRALLTHHLALWIKKVLKNKKSS